MLEQPIKTVGEYEVNVWVHPQVKSTIQLSVVSE